MPVRRRRPTVHPARERAHFEGLVARRGDVYWAERTAVAPRRRRIRSALLLAGAGVDGRPGRLLEVGCGPGDYTRVIAGLTSASVVALDIAPVLARLAARGAPRNLRIISADVEALPFPAAAFDAVIGNAVLHHLRLERAIPELLRVLRPGGRFCFAEPNLLNPQVWAERTIPWIGRWLDNSPSETAFTRWGLCRTLGAFGLTEVTARPFDFLYPLTPAPLIPVVERLGRVLEQVPVLAEIAGSLLVTGRKPLADR